jgi:hypothetical protein
MKALLALFRAPKRVPLSDQARERARQARAVRLALNASRAVDGPIDYGRAAARAELRADESWRGQWGAP